MTASYRLLEHTADIGVEITAPSLDRLFEHAACALFDVLAGSVSVHPSGHREIFVKAPNREELLIRWLSDLLYLYDTERTLFSSFETLELTENNYRARIGGEPFDPARHSIQYEIKAVTYHALQVKRVAEGWKATVIFDI